MVNLSQQYNYAGLCRVLTTAQPSSFVSLLAVVWLGVACSGCAVLNISAYTPKGPSADARVMRSLCDSLPADYVRSKIWANAGVQMSDRDTLNALQGGIEGILRQRPSNPGFRSLCAIVNSYFGAWERLIIIERQGFTGEDEYGFVVIGVTRYGIKAVANLKPDETLWAESVDLRALEPDPRIAESVVAELDKARAALPERLLWFDNIDWPLYVLHDIKADGTSFSFALCGWGNVQTQKEQAQQAPLDYQYAAELVNRAKPWALVWDDTPRAAELRTAGRTYAALLAMVWESAMGRPDFYILGGVASERREPGIRP